MDSPRRAAGVLSAKEIQMPLVLLGVLLIAMKLLEIGPPGHWSWWQVLLPFPVAIVWWTWADKSGYTKRQAMKAMDEKAAARRKQAFNALGIDEKAADRRSRAIDKDQAKRERRTAKLRAEREARDAKARDSIIHSRIDESPE